MIEKLRCLRQMRLKAGDSSYLAVRAGLQNVLQIFVTNAANVFLLEVSPEYPILLEEQVSSSQKLNLGSYVGVLKEKIPSGKWGGNDPLH